MKKFLALMAVAAIAVLAVACGSKESTTTTTTTTTDAGSATDTTAAAGDVTATTAGDATATSAGDATATTAGDATSTTAGDKGCLSDGDKAFLEGLSKDKAAADKFADDVKNCLLAKAATKTDQKEAADAIGACLNTDKGNKISTVCGACYGIRAFCTFNNCVKNPSESSANCLAAPNGEPCVACQTKYKCVELADACKAGN
jgi:hypothetical protein